MMVKLTKASPETKTSLRIVNFQIVTKLTSL